MLLSILSLHCLEKPNSVVLKTEMERQIAQICEEVAAVAKGVWEDQGFDSVCPSALEMQKFATETARQTASNRSSMLQDILAGRPTEIDYINGWIVKKAEGLQIDVPENTRLVDLIKQKEAEREKCIVLELTFDLKAFFRDAFWSQQTLLPSRV